MTSIYNDVFNLLKSEKTKIAKKAHDVLYREGIADIIKHCDVFWFEFYSRGNDCPQYVYNYLKKFIKRKFNLKYLLEAAENV